MYAIRSYYVISIDKIKVCDDKEKIKATILDISFCGDYYELQVSLDDYENKELLVKTSCLDCLEDETSCYLDMDKNNIKIVKEFI